MVTTDRTWRPLGRKESDALGLQKYSARRMLTAAICAQSIDFSYQMFLLLSQNLQCCRSDKIKPRGMSLKSAFLQVFHIICVWVTCDNTLGN